MKCILVKGVLSTSTVKAHAESRTNNHLHSRYIH